MNDFVLLGHDNPLGRYPAPVIPVGQLNGDLVAIYPGGAGATPEQVQGDCLYVSYQDALRRKLKDFNYRTDRLFAYHESDVTFFPSEHEKDFLKDFLLHSKWDREDSFLRLLLAKQTGDLPLIVREMGVCAQILLEEAPSFVQRWCASELVEVYPQIDLRRIAREMDIIGPAGLAGETKPLILIADDDRAIVEAYKHYLENAGYAVSVAYDGDEALEKVRREVPRLILLDIVMPKKSGVEVLEELRRDPSSKEIPVIVMTGAPLDIPEDIGANMYLQKGNYNLAQLKTYAEGLLGTRKVG